MGNSGSKSSKLPIQPCDRRADDGHQSKGDKGYKTPAPPPPTPTPTPPRTTPVAAAVTRPNTSPATVAPWTGTPAATRPVTETQSTSTGQVPDNSPLSSGAASTDISTGSDDIPPGRGPSTLYTSKPTASLSYSADPSGGTRTTSLVAPTGSGTGNLAASSSNAGIIVGSIIAALFVLFLVAFILYRYASARRRRGRVAPSTRYMAQFRPRPLSWGHFFADRGSSYTVTNVGDSQPDLTTIHDRPEMRESQSHSGHTSVGVTRGHSTPTEDPFTDSGHPVSESHTGDPFTDLGHPVSESHTSVGAARGHSPPPENPFSDSGHPAPTESHTVSEV